MFWHRGGAATRPQGRRSGTWRADDGATAVEYAIVVGFIAVVLIAAARALGLAVVPYFQSAAAGMP